MNDRGEASGLKVIWKLDEFYTAYVIEDIARDGNRTREKALADIARETQENLAEFDYFVRVRANDEPQTFKVTKPMKAWVDDRNLWMDFTVGFDRPLDLAARSVRYAVSDPTYYIEITYPGRGYREPGPRPDQNRREVRCREHVRLRGRAGGTDVRGDEPGRFPGPGPGRAQRAWRSIRRMVRLSCP